MSVIEQSDSVDIQTLYHQHHRWLQSWLHQKLSSYCDAEDIAQDTFVRLMARQREAFGDEPRALLSHIAYCLVVDHWRRQDVKRAYDQAIAHLPAPEMPSPEARWIILEALHRIEAMLRGLPELTRNIFLLAQLDGMKYAAIAEQLDVSLPTVKRHMRKAFLACLSLD